MAVLGAREKIGRQIALDFAEDIGESIGYGTLYTTLRRLRDSGLVEARDDVDADGRVRYFKITAEGLRTLSNRSDEYYRLATLGSRHGGAS